MALPVLGSFDVALGRRTQISVSLASLASALPDLDCPEVDDQLLVSAHAVFCCCLAPASLAPTFTELVELSFGLFQPLPANIPVERVFLGWVLSFFTFF